MLVRNVLKDFQRVKAFLNPNKLLVLFKYFLSIQLRSKQALYIENTISSNPFQAFNLGYHLPILVSSLGKKASWLIQLGKICSNLLSVPGSQFSIA